MDFGEVLKTYLGGDQQGQLVIKFVGEDHLCKISIENGQAVYLTLGNLSPAETLDAIVGKAGEWSNFINGMPIRKRVDQALNQLLFDIAGAAPLADGEVPLASSAKNEEAPVAQIKIEGDVDAGKIGETINRFIDLIGPLGTLLVEKIGSNLAYSEGAAMDSATFSRFLAALAAEVPDDARQDFVDAATR